MKPYKDQTVDALETIRTFDDSIDPIHLMWHRDDEDRKITILECGKDWKLQFDDALPFVLESNTSIFILRHQWHRVIKGTGDLVVKIVKCDT